MLWRELDDVAPLVFSHRTWLLREREVDIGEEMKTVARREPLLRTRPGSEATRQTFDVHTVKV